jgi:hypothetical protein
MDRQYRAGVKGLCLVWLNVRLSHCHFLSEIALKCQKDTSPLRRDSYDLDAVFNDRPLQVIDQFKAAMRL